MTKKTALFWTYRCWNWLAKHPNNEKEEWPGFKKFDKIKNSCFCCHFAQTILDKGCKFCPILPVWNGKNCEEKNSPWKIWVGIKASDTESLKIRKECALKIANFALKEYGKLK